MSASVTIADIPFRPDVIDKIIPTLQAWGVFNQDGNSFAEDTIIGQFVLDELKEVAYFEVVVGVD